MGETVSNGTVAFSEDNKDKKNKKLFSPESDSVSKYENGIVYKGEAVDPKSANEELISIFEDVGEFGLWQALLAAINMLYTINAGIQNNAYPMLVGTSNNWDYGCRRKDDQNFTLDGMRSCDIPQMDPLATPIPCDTADGNYEMVYHHEHFKNAIINEFHLMCGYANYLGPLVHSAFTIGCFFGVFLFGWLADWLGRKKALCIGSPIMVLLNFALAFSTNIYMFLVIRLFQGLTVFGTFTVVYVISMETTAPSKRAMLGNIVHIPWGLQFITVSLFAMWLKDWRYQQICYAIPSIACVISLFWLTESPRWLAINGNVDKATTVFVRGAKWNGRKLSHDLVKSRVEAFCNHTERSQCKESNLTLAIGLIKTPEMRRRFLLSAVVWFQGAFCNHGANFYAPAISDNPYFAYCLVGLFEFVSPAVGACVFTFGRRVPLVISFAVCSFFLFNIITVFIIWPEDHQYQLLAMLLLVTFLSDMAFNGIYVHVSEFMPTTHRSIGLGTCSSVARIGSSLSSVMVQSANQFPNLPPSMFGLLALAGSVCTFFLPSTENKELPETIEEVEEEGRRREFPSCFSGTSSNELRHRSTANSSLRRMDEIHISSSKNNDQYV